MVTELELLLLLARIIGLLWLGLAVLFLLALIARFWW
jgi:hypothetical protein